MNAWIQLQMYCINRDSSNNEVFGVEKYVSTHVIHQEMKCTEYLLVKMQLIEEIDPLSFLKVETENRLLHFIRVPFVKRLLISCWIMMFFGERKTRYELIFQFMSHLFSLQKHNLIYSLLVCVTVALFPPSMTPLVGISFNGLI